MMGNKGEIIVGLLEMGITEYLEIRGHSRIVNEEVIRIRLYRD